MSQFEIDALTWDLAQSNLSHGLAPSRSKPNRSDTGRHRWPRLVYFTSLTRLGPEGWSTSRALSTLTPKWPSPSSVIARRRSRPTNLALTRSARRRPGESGHRVPIHSVDERRIAIGDLSARCRKGRDVGGVVISEIGRALSHAHRNVRRHATASADCRGSSAQARSGRHRRYR